MKTMRIALYARISTTSGNQDANNQLLQLREWACRLGGEITGEYTDKCSGAKSDRVALKRLLDDAHRCKFDTMLIWALDRLSREGIGRMAGYLEQLKGCGVRVLSHQEPWLDTAGPVAELITAVFAWTAKFERRRLSERVLAGLERARKQGKKLGRPKSRIDKEKALKLRREGSSIRRISQLMGIPRSTVSDLLSEKGPPKTGLKS